MRWLAFAAKVETDVVLSGLGAGMFLFKRLIVVYAVLFSAGCSLPMHTVAEYENGIGFEGYDGVISSVYWHVNRDNPSVPCTLVVHLDGIDLDQSKFASAKTMRSLGARTVNDNKDWFDLSLDKPDVRIGCIYRQGHFASVTVTFLDRPHGKASVTVNGKDVSLPIKDDKLLETLGKPSYFRKQRQSF